MQIAIPIHDHTTPDAIFPFDAIEPGERMHCVNDHNPIPPLQQRQQRYGDKIEINYLDQGPQGVTIDFLVN